jgi:hypothetical protein
MDIGSAELRDILAHYQPTPESPQPDDEWIAEEYAMRQVANALEVEVTDVSSVNF